MPYRKTNRFPIRDANERGSAETIAASNVHGTPSLASQITANVRVSSRVLPKTAIDDNSGQECLFDNETDDRETDDQENDDVDPRAPL